MIYGSNDYLTLKRQIHFSRIVHCLSIIRVKVLALHKTVDEIEVENKSIKFNLIIPIF